MFDRTRTFLLCLAAGASLMAADAQPPAAGGDAKPADATKAADKPAPLTFTGVIHSKKGVVIKVVKDAKDQKDAKDKEPQPFELTDQVKVTLDGKDSNIKHLVPELHVLVTYDAKGVISVEATSKAKKK